MTARCRLAAAALAAFGLLAAFWAGTAPAQLVARSAVEPAQRVAALFGAHRAFARPSAVSAALRLSGT